MLLRFSISCLLHVLLVIVRLFMSEPCIRLLFPGIPLYANVVLATHIRFIGQYNYEKVLTRKSGSTLGPTDSRGVATKEDHVIC